MTITVELSPETEERLLAQAQARGLSLDAFVQTIIISQASATVVVDPLASLALNDEEIDRAVDAIFDAVQVPPGVGQGTMRRENWYR